MRRLVVIFLLSLTFVCKPRVLWADDEKKSAFRAGDGGAATSGLPLTSPLGELLERLRHAGLSSADIPACESDLQKLMIELGYTDKRQRIQLCKLLRPRQVLNAWPRPAGSELLARASHVVPAYADDDDQGWGLGYVAAGNSSTFSARDAVANRWTVTNMELALKNSSSRALDQVRSNHALRYVKGVSAIAIYVRHDAGIAVSKNGRVQCLLELERLFNVRYFEVTQLSQLLTALHAVRDRCECDDGKCPQSFDHGVVVQGYSGDWGKGVLWRKQVTKVVEAVFPVKTWYSVNHHDAHAASGFFASPFRSAFVFSYDGGGNDGSTNAYIGAHGKLDRVAQLDYRLGVYASLAAYMFEISDVPLEQTLGCSELPKLTSYWVVPPRIDLPMRIQLALSGKLMGYSGTANASSEMRAYVRSMFEEQSRISTRSKYMPLELLRILCGPEEGQRVLAASVQEEWEAWVHEIVVKLMAVSDAEHMVDGIVLSGGCALNVLLNQRLHDTIPNISGVYVPPAPNDAGLALGGLWAVSPPLVAQPLQYLGFRLWDESKLDEYAREWGAQSLDSLGGVEFLAALLVGDTSLLQRANGTRHKPIVGLVRGRQEYGPRALGHRSLISVPDSLAMRGRMNTLKSRKWYRPVAPMIADEDLEQVFGRRVKSPHMSMAPRVLDDVIKQFPAIAHFDGTARHQSVGKDDEPWVHALLLAVGRHIGLAALINTSFNSRGLPIVNTVRDCLEMLRSLPDLDYVLIEDWLFQAPMNKSLDSPAVAEQKWLLHSGSYTPQYSPR